MSIRIKTLLISAVIISLALFVSSSVTSEFLNRQFHELEWKNASQNITRVNEAMRVELENLDTKLSDWATWDDSYEFVYDKNSAFTESNLTVQSLINLKINSMLFYKESGAHTHDLSINLADETVIQTPEALRAAIHANWKLFTFEKQGDHRNGILMVDNRPVMIAARPILQSDGSGPVHGTLFFVRTFDEIQIARLTETTKSAVHVHGISDALDGHEKVSADILSKDVPTTVMDQSPETLLGYTRVYDIRGDPAFDFTISMPREINAQRIRTNYFISVFAAINGFVFFVLFLLILDNLVLRRLSTLDHEIHWVTKEHDLHARLAGPKAVDEIGRVSASVNSLLQSIEHNQNLLATEREQSKAYLSVIGVMIVVLAPDGIIRLVNRKTCEMIGKSEEELLGKNWFEMTIPEADRSAEVEKFKTSLQQAAPAEDQFTAPLIITGSSHVIRWHRTVMRTAEGAAIAAIYSGEDITKQAAWDEELRVKNEELEQMNAAMVGRELKMAQLKNELNQYKNSSVIKKEGSL